MSVEDYQHHRKEPTVQGNGQIVVKTFPLLMILFVSNLFFRPIFPEKLNFYFMKKAKIPVYGDSAVYVNIALSVNKIDYTLICLKYICSVSSPVRRHGFSLRSRPLAS